MIQTMRFFLLISFLVFNCAFAKPSQDIIEQGNIVYCHKKGKIQCQSEINPSQEITILLTRLKKNSEIQFQKIARSKDGLTLKVIILVTNSFICSSWVDIQEVNLPIDPIPVDTFSLRGKQIYKSNGIRVLLKN